MRNRMALRTWSSSFGLVDWQHNLTGKPKAYASEVANHESTGWLRLQVIWAITRTVTPLAFGCASHQVIERKEISEE